MVNFSQCLKQGQEYQSYNHEWTVDPRNKKLHESKPDHYMGFRDVFDELLEYLLGLMFVKVENLTSGFRVNHCKHWVGCIQKCAKIMAYILRCNLLTFSVSY